MKKLCFVFLLYSSCLFASDTFFSNYLGFARPYLIKMFGEEKVLAWYGEEKVEVKVDDEIKMPLLPKVQKIATSTENLTLGLDPKSRFRFLTPDEVKKLNFNFLVDLFSAVLKKEATDTELSQWLNILEQGGSREGIYRAIVLDQNYASLEGQALVISDDAINFSIEVLFKYVGFKSSAESLRQMNIYSIKRILTEKLLEMFDEIKRKPDDFYNWFSILNAELATKHGSKLNSKMAKETSPHKIKQWAKYMPEQHLKSDLIIKVHTILNLL